jgi:hypothetical protein
VTITINVNGITLCHRGSGGITHNTLPDVCKTPGQAIPIPYQNEAYSKDLVKGTTTCHADGGNMIANYGSEFAVSVFDEAGSIGGVVSGTHKAEADWITHSFDVFFEKKGACRLTDKMFQNHRNTVNLAGLAQAPLEAWPELLIICELICQCDKTPTPSRSGASNLKQECVEKALIAADDSAGGTSPIKAEMPYNMTTKPPTPIYSRELLNSSNVLRASQYLPRRMKEMGLKAAAQNGGIYDVRIPDAVITRNPGNISQNSLLSPNLKAAVEIKFDQPRDPSQIKDYQKIVGPPENRVVELSPKECRCDLPEKDRSPALEKVKQKATQLETEAEKGWIDSFGDALESGTGIKLTGAALVGAFLIWQATRVYPPRNLIPL